MMEKTIVRDLSATLHTERLSWLDMDTYVLLVWFYDSKAISLTYRCLHGLSRTFMILLYCLSVLYYKYNFVNKAIWVLLNLTLWPSLLRSPA